MKRFSSIENINRKYRNSQFAPPHPIPSVVGGYPSSYHPPRQTIIHGASEANTVILPTAFRSSYHGTRALSPGLAPATEVVRVEQPPQVIFHQPIPGGRVPITRANVTSPEARVMPGAVIATPTIVTNPPVDIPVVSRPIHQGRPPIRRSIAGDAKGAGCPWWCWLIFALLGLLLLAGILFGLWFYLKGNAEQNQLMKNPEGIVSPIQGNQKRSSNQYQSGTLTSKPEQDQNRLKQPTSQINSPPNIQTTGPQVPQPEQISPMPQPQPQPVKQDMIKNQTPQAPLEPSPNPDPQPKQTVPEVKSKDKSEQNAQNTQNLENKQNADNVNPSVPDTNITKQVVNTAKNIKSPDDSEKAVAQPQNDTSSKPETAQPAQKNQTTTETKVTKVTCEDGFFFNQGKCIACPNGAVWNGTHCIRKRAVTTVVSDESDKTQSIDNQNESSKNEGEKEKGQQAAANAKPNSSSEQTVTEASSSSSKQNSESKAVDNNQHTDTKFQVPKASQKLSQTQNSPASQESTAAGEVKDGIKSVGEVTSNAASSLWQGTKNVASKAWEGTKNIGKSAGQSVSQAASGVTSGLKSVADATTEASSNAWDGAKSLFGGAANTASDAAIKTADGIKSLTPEANHHLRRINA